MWEILSWEWRTVLVALLYHQRPPRQLNRLCPRHTVCVIVHPLVCVAWCRMQQHTV